MFFSTFCYISIFCQFTSNLLILHLWCPFYLSQSCNCSGPCNFWGESTFPSWWGAIQQGCPLHSTGRLQPGNMGWMPWGNALGRGTLVRSCWCGTLEARWGHLVQRGEGEPAWKRCSLGRNNTLKVVHFNACLKEEMASLQVLSHKPEWMPHRGQGLDSGSWKPNGNISSELLSCQICGKEILSS